MLLSKEKSLWIQRPPPQPPYEESLALRAAVIEMDKDLPTPSLSALCWKGPTAPRLQGTKFENQ